VRSHFDRKELALQTATEVPRKRGYEQVRCSTSIPSASYRNPDFLGDAIPWDCFAPIEIGQHYGVYGD
jgi:hypothetical protein